MKQEDIIKLLNDDRLLPSREGDEYLEKICQSLKLLNIIPTDSNIVRAVRSYGTKI